MNNLLYPFWQELSIRVMDTVLVLMIVAGHIKIIWDGRSRPRIIMVNGKPMEFID